MICSRKYVFALHTDTKQPDMGKSNKKPVT